MTVLKNMTKKGKETVRAYALMSVPLLWWGVFFVVPLIMALVFSFSDLRISIDKISKFGTFQYVKVLTDEDFWQAFLNTVIWTVVMMIGNNVFGLLMAVLISKLKHCQKLFIALLFWPTLVSAIIGSTVTKQVMQSDEYGLLNMLLGAFGIAPVPWLEQESTALFGLMIMPFIFGFSIKMLIYYSAILNIPKQYDEACRLETNSSWQRFWFVTFPLIRNALVLNLLLSLIDGLKVLGPMQLITDGGPDGATNSCVLYIYKLAFDGGTHMGRATAAAFILFVIILLISLVQLLITNRKEETTYE